jgi:hypothetical protein
MDHGVNVLVLSDAGKPIFARYEHRGIDIPRLCGLLQALLSSTRDHLNAGEMRSISWKLNNNGSSRMVFLSMGALTLVAMDETGQCTELQLQLQLEYVYAQIIFSVTERIQTIYQSNASFDLYNLLQNDQPSIRSLLDSTEGSSTFPMFLTAGIPTVFPLSQEARGWATSVLKRIGDETINTVFGMLFATTDLKLITLIQPSYLPHQLHTSDVILLMHFLNRQKNNLQTSELWLPVCLPRFHSHGFLHCYAHCLVSETQLTLLLVSQYDTTDQFQHFRDAATRIRRALGISQSCNTVLEMSDNTCSSRQNMNSNDVPWKRNTNQSDNDSAQFKNDVVDEGDDDEYEIVSHEIGSASSGSSLLIEELQSIVADQYPVSRDLKSQKYMEAGVSHFIFRKNVRGQTSVREQKKMETEKLPGRLAQCICADFPWNEEDSKRSVMICYQKLQQRLRLGFSWSAEWSNKVFNAHNKTSHGVGNKSARQETAAYFCPATSFSESSANFERAVHMVQNRKTFMALNGQDHELYFTLEGLISVKDAAALGSKLMHKLVADDDLLFLNRSPTWL